MIFMGINHRLRTDDKYNRLDDEEHHKGPTPLSRLPMGLVSQVPVEYMHLICIGVVKKLLIAWVTGKYGKKNEIIWSKSCFNFKKIGNNCTVLSARICKKAKITD
jgi:hypothetical protein